jgi:hypothetical protein
MAIIARWRMPPDSWWGYSSSRFSAAGMRTRSQHLERAGPRLGRPAPDAAHGLGDLFADPQRRVERGHRLLKDHRHPPAADLAQVSAAS